MRNVLIVAVIVIGLGGLYYAYAQQVDKPLNVEVPEAVQNAPAGVPQPDPTITTTGGPAHFEKSPLITEAPLSSDYVLGNRKAPVVLVEYASLSCPHCAAFSNQVMPAIEKNYVDTGKVAYVLRQFPLNEPAMRGTMLVNCVGESDESQYYAFSRVLFDAQQRWAFDQNFMQGLESIATVGGLSREQFKNCVNNQEREMAVLKAKKQANDELKIPHTPMIYINGEIYEGQKTAEAISAFIDRKLAEKGAM